MVVLFASGIVPSLKIGDADFKASTLTWEMVGQLRAFAADLMPNCPLPYRNPEHREL